MAGAVVRFAVRRPPHWAAAAGLAVLIGIATRVAHAQGPADASTPTAPPSATGAAPGRATALPERTPEAPPLDTAALVAAMTAQKAEIDAQKKALEEASKRVDDLDSKVDAAQAPAEGIEDKFKIYGFTDVGVERVWLDPTTPTANFLNSSNATSFVIGNLDFYFDAKPVKDWRSLVEIRFTNAPQGLVTGLGGLGGGFKRTSTQQLDPNSGSLAAQMWTGTIVIERAQVDWTHFDAFKLRVGNFLTPFGIWNVDHGTPTLIAIQEPLLLQYQGIPIRQTGLMAFGNAFAGDWELGYMATLTNGRQELSNFAFNDDRGFGARIYANDEKGDLTLKFGASGYTGRTQDLEIDATSLAPLTITSKANWKYREWIGGLDVSIDVGRTRIRAEAAIRKVDFDPGFHDLANPLDAAGAFQPNSIYTSAYVLVAHQLPFLGLQPYLLFDTIHGPFTTGDTGLGPSVGLNVRFNPSVMLKMQVLRALEFDFRKQPGNYPGLDIAKGNFTDAVARLVVVF